MTKDLHLFANSSHHQSRNFEYDEYDGDDDDEYDYYKDDAYEEVILTDDDDSYEEVTLDEESNEFESSTITGMPHHNNKNGPDDISYYSTAFSNDIQNIKEVSAVDDEYYVEEIVTDDDSQEGEAEFVEADSIEAGDEIDVEYFSESYCEDSADHEAVPTTKSHQSNASVESFRNSTSNFFDNSAGVRSSSSKVGRSNIARNTTDARQHESSSLAASSSSSYATSNDSSRRREQSRQGSNSNSNSTLSIPRRMRTIDESSRNAKPNDNQQTASFNRGASRRSSGRQLSRSNSKGEGSHGSTTPQKVSSMSSIGNRSASSSRQLSTASSSRERSHRNGGSLPIRRTSHPRSNERPRNNNHSVSSNNFPEQGSVRSSEFSRTSRGTKESSNRSRSNQRPRNNNHSDSIEDRSHRSSEFSRTSRGTKESSNCSRSNQRPRNNNRTVSRNNSSDDGSLRNRDVSRASRRTNESSNDSRSDGRPHNKNRTVSTNNSSEDGSLARSDFSRASRRTNESSNCSDAQTRHKHPSKSQQRKRRENSKVRMSPASSTKTAATTTKTRHKNSNRATNFDDGNDKKRYCKSIAVLGTMAGVGKSVVTAGICRILANGGTNCAPFKAQNTGTRTSPALLPDPSRRKILYDSFAAKVAANNSSGSTCSEKNNSNPLSSSSLSSSSSPPPPLPEIVIAQTNDQGWGQIGMAQSMQAEACKILPRVEMNPLFFKSGGRDMETDEALCAMIVMGKEIVRETYEKFSQRIHALQSIVLDSHRSLATATGVETIVIQGAGSCSELNLMDGDIVNLPLVRRLKCPWLLVANDESGGVFAQVVGTKMCLSKSDWDLCVGVIVNKVKGGIEHFPAGMEMLEQMAGKPLFVVPFLDNWNVQKGAGIDIEKRLAWEKKAYDKKHRDDEETGKMNRSTREKPVVVVVVYPHSTISNDLGPLENDSRFCLEWRRKRLPKPYPITTAVILPGSRLTLLDLKWLQDSGWSDFIREHVAVGGTVLGLCGGYQMLGWNIKGETNIKQGIGLLPISSIVKPVECKHVNRMKGQLYPSGVCVEGFEINCGSSEVVLSERKNTVDVYQGMAPLLAYQNGKPEGMLLGRVKGTCIHGILRSASVRLELLVPKEDRKRFRSTLLESSRVSIDDPLDYLANNLQFSGLNHERLRKMIFGEDIPQ